MIADAKRSISASVATKAGVRWRMCPNRLIQTPRSTRRAMSAPRSGAESSSSTPMAPRIGAALPPDGLGAPSCAIAEGGLLSWSSDRDVWRRDRSGQPDIRSISRRPGQRVRRSRFLRIASQSAFLRCPRGSSSPSTSLPAVPARRFAHILLPARTSRLHRGPFDGRSGRRPASPRPARAQ